ncbi:phosphopyruvate hydratase [Neorickettsia sennetsu]|uniref:Enolase n=1 Tax=Ehrlichia sennetsu (strain ATCC VR-367 / Miyayama) TaxID=222891 RepID=ENO_EHRS3|nr:phosphopyruvate hydratase [Neorickettsia sennetsu]Q2GD37.1 RecName: Full=Enolase; AltName: Full=2-phospho-D-glycerate hydro-lyase; AltName: Full=2-phosphoglycerate dehydratase [Neorickettsia sennetsu str. Miyayama]ABD46044.1 enolase [Neorickettsia sennetsu str. Miyayama]
MQQIQKVKAREIFNSRGWPTIEVEVTTSCGRVGCAIAPSGASKGVLEACELLDGDKARLSGRGVLRAVENVHTIIAPALMGKSVAAQAEIDSLLIQLDGTTNKSVLGANAIVAVSLAVAKANASVRGVPLCIVFHNLLTSEGDDFVYVPPVPMLNVINGGVHADNRLAIQEFMICPVGRRSFRESMEKAADVFHRLKGLLKQYGKSTNVGDEGGFAPDLSSTEETLGLLSEAIGDSKESVKIALDAASSTFYKDGKYSIDGKLLNVNEMVDFYAAIIEKYDIVSIEDPLYESDWESWQVMTRKLSDKIHIVGDDIFVTNPKIIKKGIKTGVANAVLVKINQVGTVTETIESIKLARKAGYKVVISHRSGETEDLSIAHLAVACGGAFLKAGSLSRSERVAKYNEVLRLEEVFV